MATDPVASTAPKLYAVVPAAGVGARMQAKLAKQYMLINQLPVIEHSLQSLLQEPRILKVAVVIAAHDLEWPALGLEKDKRVTSGLGGETRAHSVLNGLQMIAQQANPEDWVLVHDAARPCLSSASLARLIDTILDADEGGILATRAQDTLKMAKQSAGQTAKVASTLDRATVWHAQTPQMFRLGELQSALSASIDSGALITDEASAMELAGYPVQLIEGESSNIKITTRQDISLAQSLLEKAVQ